MKRHIDVTALFTAIENKRAVEGVSIRQLARDLDMNPSTISRLAAGRRPDADTLVTLTGWLGLSADRFVVSAESDHQLEEDTLEIIASYLRADKALKPRTADAIESVIRVAYEQLADPEPQQE